MELLFAPMACSMAPRIVIYETDAPVRFVRAHLPTRRTEDGEQLDTISPLGQVPVLRLADGTALFENVAILSFLAELAPSSPIAPRDARDRAEQLRWLCYVNSELHALAFHYLLSSVVADEIKAEAMRQARPRLDLLERELTGRSYLLDRFTAADAYLFVVLNWLRPTPLELADWPNLSQYHAALATRPSVARAMSEERPLYGTPL